MLVGCINRLKDSSFGQRQLRVSDITVITIIIVIIVIIIVIINVTTIITAYTQNTYGGFTCRCILRIFVIIINMLWMIIFPFVSFIAMAILMLMMI